LKRLGSKVRKRSLKSLLLLGLLLGLLFSLALVLFVDAELADLSEDLGGSQFLGDLLRSLSNLSLGLLDDVLAGVLVLGGGGLELVSSGVGDISLLGLVGSSGEEDQLALVAFKSLHVQLKTFLRCVVSSVVNSDANSSGESRADLGLGELLEGEASSVSNLGRIPSGHTVDEGSQKLNRSGEDGGSLCLSSMQSSLLVSGLVEPGLDESGPVLAEVGVGELVVVLNHLANLYIQ